jgi:DNA-binding MurR/RpiR family transcriptional regulator
VREPTLLLPERIRLKHDQLSPGQRAVARFCLENPQAASELTAMRIAEQVGVSESTVVRFALRLGYDGFPHMQYAISDSVQQRQPQVPTRLPGHDEDVVANSLADDLDALGESIRSLDTRELSIAVEMLANARKIFVAGFRTSFSLAHLAAFLLRKVHPSVVLLDDMGGVLDDDAEDMTADDVLLVFSFPRYSPLARRVFDLAHGRGLDIIAITDSVLSPFTAKGHCLFVRHDTPAFFNSNVAATAVVNAIVVALTARRNAEEPGFEQRLADRFHHTELKRAP